jgi:hypothetical protein
MSEEIKNENDLLDKKQLEEWCACQSEDTLRMMLDYKGDDSETKQKIQAAQAELGRRNQR